MKIKILVFICALLFLIGGFFIWHKARAQDSVDADILMDEEISAQDLGINDPKILPDNITYPLKRLWERARIKLTLNQVKKIELQLQLASYRLIEAKKLSEKSGNEAIFQKTLENYQNEMQIILSRVENFKEKAKDNPKIDKFLDKYIDRTMKSQRLIDRLEKQFSDKPEVLEKIRNAKERVLEHFGEVIERFEEKDKIAERLDENLNKIEGSKYKNFKNLEVLLELENKVPEQAKNAIQKAQENALKRLHGDLNNMSPEDQKKFSEYLEKIGGDQTIQLKVLEKLKEKQSSNELKKNLNQTKAEIQQRVDITKRDLIKICPDKSVSATIEELKDCVPSGSDNLPGKESGTTICPMYWAPVCGKDNKTYSNIVCAKAAGAEVAYSGECRVSGPIERLGCRNLCGDGKCQQIVCMAIGCPCAETKATCPQDCK